MSFGMAIEVSASELKLLELHHMGWFALAQKIRESVAFYGLACIDKLISFSIQKSKSRNLKGVGRRMQYEICWCLLSVLIIRYLQPGAA